MLGDHPFLAGDGLSLADVMIGPQLDFLAATPAGQAALHGTRLMAWLERMRVRPSFEATRPPMLQNAA